MKLLCKKKHYRKVANTTDQYETILENEVYTFHQFLATTSVMDPVVAIIENKEGDLEAISIKHIRFT